MEADRASVVVAPPTALTHTDAYGRMTMVDVGHKDVTQARSVEDARKHSTHPAARLQRSAVASARILLGQPAFAQVAENRLKKARFACILDRFSSRARALMACDQGDVFAVAQLAGIQAAKQTPHLIPLCHSLSLRWVRSDDSAAGVLTCQLSCVNVQLSLDSRSESVLVRAEARTMAATGVEMEALTGACC